MYTPCVAIVGRPNVGKSTIFNRCTRSRDALVADVPGLTRDRQYGLWESSLGTMIVVDTAGVTAFGEGVDAVMQAQAALAMEEAQILLFVVDGTTGPVPDDFEFLDFVRKHQKPVLLVVNKIDGSDSHTRMAEFYGFGLPMTGVSAAHSRGFLQLAERIVESLPVEQRPVLPIEEDLESPEDSDCNELMSDDQAFEDEISAQGAGENNTEEGELPDSNMLLQARWQKRLKLNAADDASVVRMAVIGRPNVGKSTLVNRLLGENRVAVFDMPGTTRDSIAVPFERHGQSYVLIDTAGVRRRAKVDSSIEKFSVIKTLQAIEMAHVVLCVVDASEGLVEQDLHMLSLALRAGRSVVLVVNKWDGLDEDQKARVKTAIDRRLTFAPYVGVQMISALHGTGVGHLLGWVTQAFKGAQCRTSANELTALISQAVDAHQPPAVRGRRIKLRYAHWGGVFPPTLVIHGNQLNSLPESYLRYLENYVREHLGVKGTPIKIELRVGKNPYAGKKNRLTERQILRKKRLMKHVKKR